MFEEADILQKLAMQNGFIRAIENDREWWDLVPLGSTCHYHESFGKFVRCSIVDDNGTKKAMPKALVGAWDSHDLPRVLAWGELRESSSVRRIRTQEAFRPNSTFFYEASLTLQRSKLDPRAMDELDLTPPAYTESQLRAKKMDQLREELAKMLSPQPRGEGEYADLCRAVLLAARDRLNAELGEL